MSDTMEGCLVFICFMVWLACGGVAFAKLLATPDSKDSPTGALLVFCLILAPFALGAALAFDAPPKPSKE